MAHDPADATEESIARRALNQDELDEEEAVELPDREEMSVITGSGVVPAPPLAAMTEGDPFGPPTIAPE